MPVFQSLLQSIKTVFRGESESRQAETVTKQRDILNAYTNTTTQQPTQHNAAANSQTKNSNLNFTEVSEIVEHLVQRNESVSLDILCDSLGLNRRKIIFDRGVVSIPFDASCCDFATKRQIAQAVAKEFNLTVNVMPSNIACTETSKRAFASIKAAREECFICGTLILTINQDIDDNGFMLAEITNTHNGNSVFFDIPASISADGVTDVNYDLIVHNFIVARDKVS